MLQVTSIDLQLNCLMQKSLLSFSDKNFYKNIRKERLKKERKSEKQH